MEVLQNAITLLTKHGNEDFVSKVDALKAARNLYDFMTKDHAPIKHPDWIIQVLDEVNRAEIKHPDWPVDKIYSLAIIGEEFGEAMREAVKIEMDEPDKSISNLKKELIQTIVTCVRALKNID